MGMMAKTPIAFCFLARDGDDRQKCELFEESLVVIKDGRSHTFPISKDIRITFSKKKWMLPLIIGSIALALSLLFIFRNLLNPWFSQLLMVSSAFAIYFGWQGSAVMLIRGEGISNLFPIKNDSVQLREFVKFVQYYLEAKQGQLSNILIYHISPQSNWDAQTEKPYYSDPSLEKEGFIHCSTKDQIVDSYLKYYEEGEALILLCINPLELDVELKYDPSPHGGQLFPHIYGSISRQAIVASHTFEDQNQLKALLINN